MNFDYQKNKWTMNISAVQSENTQSENDCYFQSSWVIFYVLLMEIYVFNKICLYYVLKAEKLKVQLDGT